MIVGVLLVSRMSMRSDFDWSLVDWMLRAKHETWICQDSSYMNWKAAEKTWSVWISGNWWITFLLYTSHNLSKTRIMLFCMESSCSRTSSSIPSLRHRLSSYIMERTSPVDSDWSTSLTMHETASPIFALLNESEFLQFFSISNILSLSILVQ